MDVCSGSQDHHTGSLTFNQLTVGSECERRQFGDSGGRGDDDVGLHAVIMSGTAANGQGDGQ